MDLSTTQTIINKAETSIKTAKFIPKKKEEILRADYVWSLNSLTVPEDLVKQGSNRSKQKPQRCLQSVRKMNWRKWTNQRRNWRSGNAVEVSRRDRSATISCTSFFFVPFSYQNYRHLLLRYKLGVIAIVTPPWRIKNVGGDSLMGGRELCVILEKTEKIIDAFCFAVWLFTLRNYTKPLPI